MPREELILQNCFLLEKKIIYTYVHIFLGMNGIRTLEPHISFSPAT